MDIYVILCACLYRHVYVCTHEPEKIKSQSSSLLLNLLKKIHLHRLSPTLTTHISSDSPNIMCNEHTIYMYYNHVYHEKNLKATGSLDHYFRCKLEAVQNLRIEVRTFLTSPPPPPFFFLFFFFCVLFCLGGRG